MAGKRTRHVAIIGFVALGAFLSAHVCRAAEAPAVERRLVFNGPMSIPDRDAIMALVELPPGTSEGRHTHPGELFGFVLEGSITVENEGSPTLTLKAGDVYHVLPGKVHDVLNHGNVTARTAVVLVAERGKPPTTELK